MRHQASCSTGPKKGVWNSPINAGVCERLKSSRHLFLGGTNVQKCTRKTLSSLPNSTPFPGGPYRTSIGAFFLQHFQCQRYVTQNDADYRLVFLQRGGETHLKLLSGTGLSDRPVGTPLPMCRKSYSSGFNATSVFMADNLSAGLAGAQECASRARMITVEDWLKIPAAACHFVWGHGK